MERHDTVLGIEEGEVIREKRKEIGTSDRRVGKRADLNGTVANVMRHRGVTNRYGMQFVQ